MSEYTNEDFLSALREAQGQARRPGPANFEEYRQETLRKAPRSGGVQSPISNYGPGFGLMGHLNTNSTAPTGPNSRPSGNQATGRKSYIPEQFGVPSGVDFNQNQSQYRDARPNQPPPWIDDVDLASVFYSPMEPVWPFGPPNYTVPREWNFPVGYNLNYVSQRLELMGMLRGMRQSWGVLATIIETRKDQLLRLPWTIQVRGRPRASSKFVDEIREFFRRPDRKLKYSQWARKYLDDLFVIDAPSVFIDRNLGGKVRAAQILDGATIFPLIDDVGRRPDTEYRLDENGLVYEHRQPAFQQIIYGLPMINLSEDELIYGMMRPRPEMPVFGFSPVEQILTEATEAIRKTFYQLEFWRCYDDDTEVLTRRGWLPFILITQEDEFATRNPETKEFEWQKATDYFREFYVGDMIQFSGQRIDLLVTPNHRMILSGLPRALGGHTWRKGEAVVLASDLVGVSTKNCGVPITSVWVGKAITQIRFEDLGLVEALLTDQLIADLRNEGRTLAQIGAVVGRSFQYVSENLAAQAKGWVRTQARSGGADTVIMEGNVFCAFMGMWLSEGWVHNGKNVCIAQKRESKGYEEFRELLIKIFGKEPYYDEKGWEVSSVHLAQYLLQFGHAKDKFVPEEIMNATPEQIEVFFHYYHLGDGAEQTKIMYTTSKRMADQFVELAQKMGRNASLHVDDRIGKEITKDGKKTYYTASVCYGVRIYEFGDYTKDFEVETKTDFAGYVSCVTVPNGTLLVRRNNKTVWSGNSGSIPELLVTVPDTWSPRQIATYQGHFDALLSGQLSLKSKVRFIPGGMKPFDIKNASGESLWSQRDELLIRLCCYAFSVSPTPFVHQMNRATANQSQEASEEEGLFPVMSYWKDDVMDTIIQEKFGYDDVEFSFLPRPEADQSKQATIHQIQLHDGMRTINEVRAEQGYEPIPDGDYPLIYTGNTVVRLDQVISGETLMAGQGGNSVAAADPKPVPQGKETTVPIRGGARPATASPLPPKPTPVHKAVTAKQVRQAAKQAERDPSSIKRKVGNYPKGHLWLHGLSLSIENEKGSLRGEKDRVGVDHYVKMPAPYGYIRGTIGADGMQVDCYIGRHPESKMVWVIDQDRFDVNGEDKGFDEHKVMLGYSNPNKAIKDYMKSHYDGFGHERLSAITAVTYSELKKWLKTGNMKAPISEQGVGQVIGRRGKGNGITKADTISQSTGLLNYDQLSLAPSRERRHGKKKRKGLRSGPRWLSLAI